MSQYVNYCQCRFSYVNTHVYFISVSSIFLSLYDTQTNHNNKQQAPFGKAYGLVFFLNMEGAVGGFCISGIDFGFGR